MARNKSKAVAKVETKVEVPVQAVAETKPEYIPRECIYGLLVNDKVTYQDGHPPSIEGDWHITFVDTRTPNTAYGPYLMHDSLGQKLSEFVALDMLKDVARRMWQGDLGNYQTEPFPIMSNGCKIMSCMIFD